MDFNIRAVAKTCSQTGRMFVPGETCWSVLLEQDGKLIRQDYSMEAWHGAPKGAIGHWQLMIPAAEPSRLRLDPDSLFDYFLQLNDSPNFLQAQYRYVLALLLLRKRRLILEEVVQVDDRPTMILVGSGGEGPFEIPEEELSEDQIVRLQQQLFESGRNIAA